MTINLVTGQICGASANDSSTTCRPVFPGNVTAGNYVYVQVFRYGSSSDPLVAGDVTKNAGTSTIGTVALDCSIEYQFSAGNYFQVGIYSIPVTGTGSLTLDVAQSSSSVFRGAGAAEFHTNAASLSFLTNTNKTGSGTTGAPTTTDASSTEGGAVFIGSLGVDFPGAGTITPDAAFSQVYEQEDGTQYLCGSGIYRIVTTGTTDAASWSAPTTVAWAAALAVYQEPSSTPSPNVSDSIALTEGKSVVIQTSDINKSENISVTENVLVQVQTLVNISDNVSITENVVTNIQTSINVSDNISVTENKSVSIEGAVVTLNVEISPDTTRLVGVRIYPS